MNVSIYSRTLDATPQPISTTLDVVKGHGLGGCMVASVFDVSKTLDPSELRDVRAYAESLGLFLDVAGGQINPYHFGKREDIVAAGDGDFRTGLERVLLAAQILGCSATFFTVGALVDRFSRSVPWANQVAATTSFLKSLRPFLLDHDLRLDVKTHEEITSDECVRIVEQVGPDVMGIGFDPVNVLVRLEAPVESARRVGPYCTRAFLSDADLFFTASGIDRKLRAVGDGILDWPGMLAVLAEAGAEPSLTIELHRGQFGMPIFDRAWIAAQTDLRLPELAEVVRLTVVSEEKLKDPARPPREAFQVNVLERLPATLAYLPTLLGSELPVGAGVSG
ncbi:MAG: sugar phosphate isomerase/epimerase [Chloroflexi bacterium]|nr:sugar phosphate isomerase/epimerase [Chloroflexota bacterium]